MTVGGFEVPETRPPYPRSAISVLPRVANGVLLLAASLPVLLVAWYVNTRGNSVPVGDQWWDDVYIAVKTRAGILTAQDLFVFFEGHRQVVIRLITVFFTAFTDFDLRVLRFGSFMATLLDLWLAVLLLSKTHRRLIPAGVFLFAVLLFTLHHANSWLDYHFAIWQLALFFVLLGMLIVQRMRPGWVALALLMLCAMAASFSIGFGLAAWISLPIAASGVSAYRHPRYLTLWFLALVLFVTFYASNYAVSPYDAADPLGGVPGLALRDGVLQPLLYLLAFQTTRFDTDTINQLGLGLTLICSLVLAINLAQIARSKAGRADAMLWASLAVFAVTGAALTAVGRGVHIPVAARYSPGGDAFWIAFIATALLVVMRPLRTSLAVLNAVLLFTVVVLTVQKDRWSLQVNDPFPQACDQCMLDYPLRRDGCFRECFRDSEDQSVYHLAALRLSLFRHETPTSIVPSTDARVITDMPNRWLSVYVRDYLLNGVVPENLYSIAPTLGEWLLPSSPYSPFYRGEWPVDSLVRPLTHTWTSAAVFTSDLDLVVADQPLVWYLNTPETETHFAAIQQAFTGLDYAGHAVSIRSKRYSSARFGLWCFERIGSGACGGNSDSGVASN